MARQKLNDTKDAKPSEKNATEKAKESQEDEKNAKEGKDESSGKFDVKKTNGFNNAPASKPICNGKNRGDCEVHTLTQGDTYGANKTHRNEYARVKREETPEPAANKTGAEKAKEDV